MADKSKKQKNPKKRCPECGRVMKQQVGLRHCKCGVSSQNGKYFERTSDMVFALERKATKKGKNSVKVKQVPVVRHKPEPEVGDSDSG